MIRSRILLSVHQGWERLGLRSTELVALINGDVVSLANLGNCHGVVCRLVSEGIGDAAGVVQAWVDHFVSSLTSS